MMDPTRPLLKRPADSRQGPTDGNQRKRPKRSSRACERCHRRKVRCDGVINGFPCTNCRLDEYPCTLQPTIRQPSEVKQLFRTPSAHATRGDTPQSKLKSSTSSTQESSLFDIPYLNTSGLKRLTPEKIVLLETHGSLRVPSKATLDALIKHYFLYVHPCFPLLDEAAFWRDYRRPNKSNGGISIVLFRAMLFAASPFATVEVAEQCGHESLLQAREDLYQRAKLLYDSGAEADTLDIARSALLLSYYTNNIDTSTNSTWLKIAINAAKQENAHLYYIVPSPTGKSASDLKRLWWSCVIRDRLISLGMRRPIQITSDEFDHRQQGLTIDDLEGELFNSEVYGLDTKTSLCQVLSSLCHFVVAVTDLLQTVYPTTKSESFDVEDCRVQVARLEKAKSAMLQWELNWMTQMEGKDFYLHPSLTLYENLLSIYYQTARMALSNHMCSLISTAGSLRYEDLKRIESCRSDLMTAIGCTAEKVRELIINGVADKLPINAMAYTMLPQLLLSIKTELSKTPEDKQKNEVMLVLFVEMNRIFSSKYYMQPVIDLVWRALKLCQESSIPSVDHNRAAIALRSDYCPDLFELRLTQYVRLLRYIDQAMASADSPQKSATQFCPPDLRFSEQIEEVVGPTTPAWMQSMEATYVGAEELQAWSSSLLLSWPAAGSEFDSSPGGDEGEDVDPLHRIFDFLPLLGE